MASMQSMTFCTNSRRAGRASSVLPALRYFLWTRSKQADPKPIFCHGLFIHTSTVQSSQVYLCVQVLCSQFQFFRMEHHKGNRLPDGRQLQRSNDLVTIPANANQSVLDAGSWILLTDKKDPLGLALFLPGNLYDATSLFKAPVVEVIIAFRQNHFAPLQ